MREQPLEVAVDHVEGGEQPLAAFTIEALDRLPELADRLDDVLALGNDRFEPVGELLLLFLGAQIDGAEPFALDLQPVELALDLGHLGHRVIGFQAGMADDQMRRRVQRFLDARFDLKPALVGRRQPFLGTGTGLARLGQRLDG
jgi:hypothetical protein